MPYLFDTTYQFKESKYQIDAKEIIEKFPFLIDKLIYGEILGTYIEGKTTKHRLPFKCKIFQSDKDRIHAEILEPNPLKEKGIPPCPLLLTVLKYEEKMDNKKVKEFPISEGLLLTKSYFPSYFEDIAKRLIKEEEIRLIFESTSFHKQLKNQVKFLRNAYLSFEEEIYPDVKTSCRKILENLRSNIMLWKEIDNSKSLYEKFKNILNSVYSFASIGGPHEGIITKEETELILKITAAIVFYVNTLLKNNRITIREPDNKI